mmetsp:Transcript_54179/g.123442  ORF Transcript_54179/g.123442 Transcript_54179/m.123442 type:complete len:464 (-) Transcript_54179:282-1673(-)
MFRMPRGLCLALLLASGSALVRQTPVIRSPNGAMARHRTLPRLQDTTAPYDSDKTIQAAVDLVEQDSKILDKVVNARSQMTAPESAILIASASAAALAPALVGPKVVEVFVPAVGALIASIGFSSEYLGRQAMSRGKENSALTIQSATECELIIAQAERIKAPVPFMVGIGVSGVALALVMPELFANVAAHPNWLIGFPQFMLFAVPLGVTWAAVVAADALERMRIKCREAINSVAPGGKPTEVVPKYENAEKIKTFFKAVLPGPILAVVCPAPHGMGIAFTTLLWTAIAALQGAYCLVVAEAELARAVDRQTLTARQAAVSEQYANQGCRNGSILPFTSSLGGICAAGAAAATEFLPLIERFELKPLECLITGFFPAIGVLFASSASVAKARCEIDAEAALKASKSFGELPKDGKSVPFGDGVMEPVAALKNLMKVSTKATLNRGKELASGIFGGGAKLATA